MTYEFISIDEKTGDRVGVIVHGVALEELLEAFDRFLRGSGFCFNGRVTIEDDGE